MERIEATIKTCVIIGNSRIIKILGNSNTSIEFTSTLIIVFLLCRIHFEGEIQSLYYVIT